MDNPTTNSAPVAPDLKQRVASLFAFMAQRLGIQQTPKITLTQNAANAKKPFGLTAYYNQQDRSVRLYVTERHPTDILRSFAHELIHHWQNEHGALPAEKKGGHAHYAQQDPVLRQREMEAYLLGNILFRDWQDENRYGPLNENLAITNSHVLKTAIKNMLLDLMKQRVIASYHRPATSGDMKPEDFLEDISKKIELELERFIETVNDRGNKENQPNVIPETITRERLKSLIKERIDEMGKGWKSNPKNKSGKGSKFNSKEQPGSRENYAQWLKAMLAQKADQKLKAQKYYDIGFDFDDKHYCWYWNDKTKQIVAARGESHGFHFGKEIPYKTFRGRYDLKTKELSLATPEYGKMKITGKMEVDVPPELIRELNRVFQNPKIIYFPFLV